ncbi:hypothetical protein BDY21DRAFT_322257 [Lineolata rhizophorae]|uniref:DUF1365-domain-containing protein n=1 Tax=Lineolata rhizophorae TaxID=578093 RepID=A0A6A6NZD5_9PEZI|nr:hypothetical protein BDY21DRAFT_322257 [Lineolata rhizophorae]
MAQNRTLTTAATTFRIFFVVPGVLFFLASEFSPSILALWLLWLSIWLLRWCRKDSTAILDLFVLLLLPTLHFSKQFGVQLKPGITAFVPFVLSVVALLVLSAGCFFVFSFTGSARGTDADRWYQNVQGQSNHTKTLLIPSRTTHSRLFPGRHSFSYSYFLIGVPVGQHGSFGALLSVDSNHSVKDARRGWLDIQALDYLMRSGDGFTLEQKLRQYLKSQGVNDSEWDHAYLVTAPRICGYSFNPVSFWYIYTSTNKLAMMILEVNNTFDERRMYLLKRNSENLKDETCGDKAGLTSTQCGRRFCDSWSKDFHVSPFSSRKGSYSFSGTDPFDTSSTSTGQINNTIVLRSSKGHGKLVARIFSEGEPIDPLRISPWRTALLLLRWSWVGFLTEPRILKEAWRLYFGKKLHVWFRPEITLSSVPRHATGTEKTIETFLVGFLSQLHASSLAPMRIIYHSAIDPANDRSWKSAGIGKTGIGELRIRIVTPAFYSRCVHYPSLSSAFEKESHPTVPNNRTVWISDLELLAKLLENEQNIARGYRHAHSVIERMRWSIFSALRCSVPAPSYPEAEATPAKQQAKGPSRREFSTLDLYVQGQCPNAEAYRLAVAELFLAERYAFGFQGILTVFDLGCRALLIGGAFYLSRAGESGVAELLFVFCLSSFVHFWAFLKGF